MVERGALPALLEAGAPLEARALLEAGAPLKARALLETSSSGIPSMTTLWPSGNI